MPGSSKASTRNLPKGRLSAEELEDRLAEIPLLRKANLNQKDSIPSCLELNDTSRQVMQAHIELIGLDKHRFLHTVKEQDQAYEMFISLGLHIPHEIDRDVRSKYSIRTSASKPVHAKTAVKGQRGRELTRWTRIYQCLCGSDSEARRLIGWKNVHCCVWIQTVTTHDDKSDANGKDFFTIDEISGILDHSVACQELLEMDRDPSIPLHPDLRLYALSLLRNNIPLSQLKALCKTWAMKHWGEEMGNNHHRIKQSTAAEDNLDLWLREDRPVPPDPLISKSVLFYQPCREGGGDRLILIIATSEMQDAAWKYGHKRHVLIDLTFGFCSARANLLIVMALDDNKKGIPIGLIVFTARPTARAVHADYDTELIRSLLDKWRLGLGTRAGSGFHLDISVATTDNDTRERTALQDIWPSVLLLLCMFHVWQCWRNGLNKYLAVIPKGDDRLHMRRRLAKFLMKILKEITEYSDAISAYNSEVEYFKALGKKPDMISQKQSKGGLAFLAYLSSYLHVRSMWLAWSKSGVIEASKRLGKHVEDIPRTNNHLESFNGRIKNKYFEGYTHAGRLPRLDLWVLVIITNVMPGFFQELRDREAQRKYYAQMRQLPSRHCSPPREPTTPPNSPSLLSPDRSATTSFEISCEEAEMLDEMIDDDNFDSDDGGNAEKLDSLDGNDSNQGFSLQIDADGVGCSVVVTEMALDDDETHDNSMVWDNNISQSDILRSLNEFLSSPFHFTPSQSNRPPSPLSLHDSSQEQNKPPMSPASTALMTAQATAMQDMLVAQDNLGQTLKRLRMLKIDDDIVSRYTPMSLHSEIFGSIADPASIGHTPVKIDVEHSCAGPLLPLVPQKKEKRKTSYGIR
ncbi:hypothetical protein JOM56_000344 [Amanita muscaria]